MDLETLHLDDVFTCALIIVSLGRVLLVTMMVVMVMVSMMDTLQTFFKFAFTCA